MRKSFGLFLIVLMGVLSGCAGSYGNRELGRSTKAELYQLVGDNITTKSDARRLLGDPSDIDYNDATNREKWIYKHTTKKPLFFGRGTETAEKRIILIFGPNGTLERSFVMESVNEQKKGWFE